MDIGESMNKVISREYVEKNYIKKADLKEFIDAEIVVIDNMIDKDIATARQLQLDGLKAGYTAIQQIFLRSKDE